MCFWDSVFFLSLVFANENTDFSEPDSSLLDGFSGGESEMIIEATTDTKVEEDPKSIIILGAIGIVYLVGLIYVIRKKKKSNQRVDYFSSRSLYTYLCILLKSLHKSLDRSAFFSYILIFFFR